MAKTDEARDEIQIALALLEPQIEGLEDYLGTDLGQDTRSRVTELLDTYRRRRTLLLAVRDAIQALTADGYPVVEKLSVSPAVFAELEGNLNTIMAAFGQFESQTQVTGGAITLGDPIPK